MADIRDIKDKNEIMSHRDFGEQFRATVKSIAGNRLGLSFRRRGKYAIPLNKWMEARCLVNGSDYKVTGNDDYLYMPVPFAQIPVFYITLLETPLGTSIGDLVTLKWDLSRLPDSWWLAGKDIVRSCFAAEDCGCTDIPAIFTGTFHQCNLTNQELHTGCSVADGDGIQSCNRHLRVQNDLEMWIMVKGAKGYEPNKPLDEAAFDNEKLSKLPADISLTKLDEPITRRAKKARVKAEANNSASYNVSGQTITNDNYVLEVIK